jgi:hypothetical protein
VTQTLVARVGVPSWAALVLLAAVAPAAAQGLAVVVHTNTEQVPLTAYAEMRSFGMLALSSGSHHDIPTVDSFRLVRTTLTGWRPAGAMVTTEALFQGEYAERRLLAASYRRVGVTAIEMRVSDLERPARVQELLAAVGAGERMPGYFFVILMSEGMTRYYPFRMAVPR